MVSERLKVNGSVARQAIRHLEDGTRTTPWLVGAGWWFGTFRFFSIQVGNINGYSDDDTGW